MHDIRKPPLSVVIPTIEEEAVFKIIQDIRKLFGESTEIIVVDKSSDKYFERLQEAGVKAIRQEGKGVERAVGQGMAIASGDIIASIDGDGTHDINGLVAAVEMIKENKADMVLGNRLNDMEKGAMSAYIKLGNKLLSALFSTLYKVQVHDILTGLFAIRKSAFEKVKNIEPYRAGVATTYAIEMVRRGYRVKEVDIKYYRRQAGSSKISEHKTGYALSVAANIIRQVRDYSPLMVFGIFGIILFAAGVAIGAMVLANFLASGQFTEIGRALIAFMLAVLGILSIFVGIILDLLLEIDRRLREKA
ncbi:MAG: glycosyltransferase [Candidatus Micrarchaeia archaeon]